MADRACIDCQKPISRSSKGRCRACGIRALNADPETTAKRLAGVQARFADPEKRAKAIAVATRNVLSWRLTPEGDARLRELGKELRKHSQTPEALAKWRAGRAASGAKRTETMLAWCPVEYRDEYRRLTRSKQMPAAEARAEIERRVAVDSRRYLDRDAAADFLQRLGPIVQCDADGRMNPRGGHWRRGSTVLTGDELVERALRNGWQPDAWREVRAA